MGRQLSEIDLTSEDVAERLITLGCGHIFTVETLDGHCEMNDYYEIDGMGQFLDLKAPPVKYQKPPVCPQCRGPINALRYGRVTKRATLDILEQNVAASMSRQLNAQEPAMIECTNSLAEMKEAVKKLPVVVGEVSNGVINKFAKARDDEPLPHDLLNTNAMQSIHGFAPEEAQEWNKIVKDLLQINREAITVAKTRGAHVKAYEAALATLYRMELARLERDPTVASDAPEPQAMANVNAQIGQPPYKADTRFQTEAFFVSLEVRFLLSEIVFSRIEALTQSSSEEGIVQHRQLWCSLNNFLLESCIRDSKKAFIIAKRSSASRQAARASLYGLRADFEKTRFGLMETRNEKAKSGGFTDNVRDELVSAIQEKKKELKNNLFMAKRDYIQSRPVESQRDLWDENQWFNENCGSKVEQWYKACDDLEQFFLKGGVYIPLSLQEREDIVKAFGAEFSE